MFVSEVKSEFVRFFGVKINFNKVVFGSRSMEGRFDKS